MSYNIRYQEYHKVLCDNCGIEINKHNTRRYKRVLEGKANFCCNKCKFEYWEKHGHYSKIRKQNK